jgi:spore maturation protein CgeB
MENMQNLAQVLRAYLKRIPVLSRLNENIRANIIKRRYEEICRYYEHINEREPKRRYSAIRDLNLNILFLGTDYQQDSGGMLQALRCFGKVTEFTKEDGSYGLSPSSSLTSLNAYDENSTRLCEIVAEMENRGESPNIIIGQMWGVVFNARIFEDIRHRYGSIIINIAMDDRHTYWGNAGSKRWMGTCGLTPYVDLVLTAAPECVDWYAKEGCPALFFPEASDPDIFHPMPELPKIHDVSFVGARYGIREKIITALRDAGISVSAFGNGWEGGKLPIEDVPRLFAQSKIVLGVGTIGHCTDFYALKLRDFDGAMSGSFYLTHDNPDLKTLYEIGREIETYRDIEDCVEKVKWYLAHDDERELIASAGRRRALKDHTWHHRFSSLIASLRAN